MKKTFGLMIALLFAASLMLAPAAFAADGGDLLAPEQIQSVDESDGLEELVLNECSGGGATCKCSGACTADSGGCSCH